VVSLQILKEFSAKNSKNIENLNEEYENRNSVIKRKLEKKE